MFATTVLSEVSGEVSTIGLGILTPPGSTEQGKIDILTPPGSTEKGQLEPITPPSSSLGGFEGALENIFLQRFLQERLK